jgi:CheY-like chemotaxis protein
MESLFGPRELANVRLLLVEDDPDGRELMTEFLGTCGIQVVGAASGDEGFARFVETRPHIVVSDLHMPRVGGLTLIGQIRALPAGEGGLTPAIAISAAGNRFVSLEAGFHAHLDKPLDPVVLVDAIRSFVQHGAPRGTWALTSPREGTLLLTFGGDVSGADVRAAMARRARARARSCSRLGAT